MQEEEIRGRGMNNWQKYYAILFVIAIIGVVVSNHYESNAAAIINSIAAIICLTLSCFNSGEVDNG